MVSSGYPRCGTRIQFTGILPAPQTPTPWHPQISNGSLSVTYCAGLTAPRDLQRASPIPELCHGSSASSDPCTKPSQNLDLERSLPVKQIVCPKISLILLPTCKKGQETPGNRKAKQITHIIPAARGIFWFYPTPAGHSFLGSYRLVALV